MRILLLQCHLVGDLFEMHIGITSPVHFVQFKIYFRVANLYDDSKEYKGIGSEVVMTLPMKNAVAWKVTSCNLVEIYRRFTVTLCPCFLIVWLLFDSEDRTEHSYETSVTFDKNAWCHVLEYSNLLYK
jgi:hypothetical protein